MPQKMSQNINFSRSSGEQSASGWPWRLFLFSFLVLATTVVVYLGLEFGYQIFLKNQISSRDAKIDELSQNIPKEEQERFLGFYSQLANLQSVLDNHSSTSKVLPFLEANTNKKVSYDSVDLRAAERKLTLDGAADSYEIFSQQLEAFNQAKDVERLVVQESQADGNIVKFRLFVILKSELFK